MTWIIERTPEESLPFTSPNASPSELLLLGRQSLTDGWQLARTYFRAALNRVLDQGILWTLTTLDTLLANRFVLGLLRLIKAIGQETLRATYQLTPVVAPGYRAAMRVLSPIRPAQMWHWLMLLLMLDGMLWAGLLGLLGLATAEGSEPVLAATRVEFRTLPQNALAAGQLPTSAPTSLPNPTPTLLPPPTATPIPLAQSVWQPSLPAETGWDGADTCSGEFLAPTGGGYFVWPANNHYLSGYDYSWWHQGLDISTLLGDPIYAVDGGVVIYAGWNTWGYGNAVIIDHGNGWHTLYAHLSQVNVACGQAVEQGAIIGQAGSTGHSTGPHLHFEMRYVGEGRVSPWLYLP